MGTVDTPSTNSDLVDETQAWRVFDSLSPSLSPELAAAMRGELQQHFTGHRLIGLSAILLMAVDRKDGLAYTGTTA